MKHMHCPDVEGYDAEALGLVGSVKTMIRVLSDNSVWLEVQPGGYTPDHQHDDIERNVVIAGKGTVVLENERKEIQANDFLEFPANEKHQFINTGDEPLIFMGFRNQV